MHCCVAQLATHCHIDLLINPLIGTMPGMWGSGRLSLLAGLAAALCLQASQAQTNAVDGKPPIVFLPGITGSELLGVYSPSHTNPTYEDSTRSSDASAAVAGGITVQGQTFELQFRPISAALSNFARQQQQQTGDVQAASLLQSDPCPPASNEDKLSVWLPLAADFLLYPNCFYHMIALKYNKQRDRFSNNTGAAVAADTGGNSGTKYNLWTVAGYDRLAAYIVRTFDYTVGRNFFAAPYDWRYDLTTMEQIYQLTKIMKRIEGAVKANGGKKAILIGHSMGSLVILKILQDPKLEAWRKSNVLGFIALAPPLAGAVRVISTRAAGSNIGSSDGSAASDVARPVNAFLQNIVYLGTMGLPAPVMLLPYSNAFGADWVVARTPSRSYTVSQQAQLLADIGDKQAVDFYDRVRNLDSLISGRNTTPDVPTYCIYGSAVRTAKTYRFRDDLKPGVRSAEPSVAAMGRGDGTVNLESLRLCRQLTRSNRITELSDGTDHTSVVTAASAHAAVGRYLRQLLNK